MEVNVRDNHLAAMHTRLSLRMTTTAVVRDEVNRYNQEKGIPLTLYYPRHSKVRQGQKRSWKEWSSLERGDPVVIESRAGIS